MGLPSIGACALVWWCHVPSGGSCSLGVWRGEVVLVPSAWLVVLPWVFALLPVTVPFSIPGVVALSPSLPWS